MMNEFHPVIYDLHKKHGQLARRVRILERQEKENMSAVDQVAQELGQLKSDLATKFGEIQTEVNALEQAAGTGEKPDFTQLRQMIGDIDTTVRGFDPVATSTGGGAPAPGPAPGGGAPGEEPTGGAPAGAGG